MTLIVVTLISGKSQAIELRCNVGAVLTPALELPTGLSKRLARNDLRPYARYLGLPVVVNPVETNVEHAGQLLVCCGR